MALRCGSPINGSPKPGNAYLKSLEGLGRLGRQEVKLYVAYGVCSRTAADDPANSHLAAQGGLRRLADQSVRLTGKIPLPRLDAPEADCYSDPV